jgi:hypothetical protein
VEDHHHFIVDWVGKLRTMIKNAIDKQWFSINFKFEN